MARSRSIVVAAAVLAAALAGCSAAAPEIVPVAGVVLLDDAPLPQARVLLFPMAAFPGAADYVAMGVTDEQGRFTLTCAGRDGACVGENVVAVLDEVPEELADSDARDRYYAYMESLENRPVPAKYRTAATSEVRIAVTGDRSEYEIKLSR